MGVDRYRVRQLAEAELEKWRDISSLQGIGGRLTTDVLSYPVVTLARAVLGLMDELEGWEHWSREQVNKKP